MHEYSESYKILRVPYENKKSRTGQNPSKYSAAKNEGVQHYLILCNNGEIHKVEYSSHSSDNLFGMKYTT